MKDYIKHLQASYYEGNALVSNEEYDALVVRFGEEGIGSGGEYKHMYRMYSLDKVYPGRGDEYPIPLSKCIKTPKLDGCAISVLYVNHNLEHGNTRGDGITSQTLLEDWKLQALLLPLTIAHSDILQITGEVVTTKDVPNMRNYASGAMQLNSEEEFKQRVEEGGLIFVAYGVQRSTQTSGITLDYLSDMEYLQDEGFCTVIGGGIKDMTDKEEIPTDGIVYRLANNKAFTEAGFTHKHPKGAFAVKEDEEAVETVLLEVVWSTGKTGKVTPTAIFEEIVIDGAKISRATLNNAGYLEAMGLEIGDTIQVIRAGGIIPKIIGKL